MRLIALLLAVASCVAMELHPEVFVMGISRHANHDAGLNERNPGLGLGVRYELSPGVDTFVAAGQYKDSFSETARYATLGVRYTVWDRLCADLSSGYLNGSGYHGLGLIPSVGVRAAPHVWVHVTGDPRNNGNQTPLVALFLRISF